MRVFTYESFSSTHDTLHKLNAPSGGTDEMEALGGQELTTEHCVIDPEIPKSVLHF